MKTFEDIQDIWQSSTQSNAIPDVATILEEVKKQHRKMLRKNIMVALLLTATAIFITILGFNFVFKFTATYIGMTIVVLTVISGVVVNTLLSVPAKTNGQIQESASSYLEVLIKYNNRQKQLLANYYGFYFLGLSIGMAIYLYEFAARNISFGVIAYLGTFSWFAFTWFYLRKRTIRKQQAKINEMIEKLEEVKKGMDV
jgi:hypothetical protein